MTVPVVRQYGFSTGSGVLANIVDGDAGVGWAPLADEFGTYTAPFLDVLGNPNVGFSFPALEFDFGVPVQIGLFFLEVERPHTLGAAMLIASNNPASSVANTLQAGDVLLGTYTAEEIAAGHILTTAAFTTHIVARYVRLLQRQQS